MLYILYSLIIFSSCYSFYLLVSTGIGNNSKHQQQGRFLIGTLLAVLPLFITQSSPLAISNLWCLFIGLFWMITHPYLYYITHHGHENDFDFPMDIALGLYTVGLFQSSSFLINALVPNSTVALIILSLVESLWVIIPLIEWCYYFFYQSCLDEISLQLALSTYAAEAKEFIHSLSKASLIALLLVTIVVFWLPLYANSIILKPTSSSLSQIIVMSIEVLFLCFYIFKSKRGVLKRTAIIELFLNVKKYFDQTKSYHEVKKQILKDLNIQSLGKKADKPSTIILVIGESASRDYMSVFNGDNLNTTPWLSSQKASSNFYLFPHTYACFNVTVPVLTLALTEANQYNDLQYHNSLSIVDIAKALGYKVSWYSNQSYIGGAETPTTIIAQTSDIATWVINDSSKQHFDNSLLDYLKDINPEENNFVVFHLKGSHFSYNNRYPESFAYYSKKAPNSLTANYRDSIRYTDKILECITTYAEKNLNLQALVYCSDHGAEPEAKRTAYFKSFETVRIPFFAYLSDEYKANHEAIAKALEAHTQSYFTNDMLYDFMCGIFDIKSNHYDEKNSLTSLAYKYTPAMLRTNLGNTPILEDQKEFN